MTSCCWTTWGTCPKGQASAVRLGRNPGGPSAATSPLALAFPGAEPSRFDRPDSVILEFDVPSYRTGVAQKRSQEQEVNRQE